MSTRNGVITGFSVLAFVAVAFVLYFIKSTIQVFALNSASTTCYNEAKAHPGDKLAMDRCLKARGVLVEDSAPPGDRARSTPQPQTASIYDECRRTPNVAKHKPKTLSWATELSACLSGAGKTGVVTMNRNPATGETEFDVAH